jgi:hypothetical protein
MWNTHPMTTVLQRRPYSKGERAVLLVTRLLTATLLTSLIGAIGNWFYERFFAPDLYAAGPPLDRALWLTGMSIPFVFVGLLILGLPAAYLLRRGRAESAISYAIVGFILGALYGLVMGPLTTHGYIACGLYGGTCALFWWSWRPKV